MITQCLGKYYLDVCNLSQAGSPSFSSSESLWEFHVEQKLPTKYGPFDVKTQGVPIAKR